MNENPVTLEFVTHRITIEQGRVRDRRPRRSLDWLNAQWGGLRFQACGKGEAVAGRDILNHLDVNSRVHSRPLP